MQDHSCALAVGSGATAGVEPAPVEMNEMAEPPAATAARHAAQYCHNVQPVRRTPEHLLPYELVPDDKVSFAMPYSFIKYRKMHRSSVW